MIVKAVLSVLAFTAMQGVQTQPVGQPSPTELANATKFDIAIVGGHVTGCTVTATSGNPDIDRYVCDAARACSDQYSAVDRSAACLVKRREQLAGRIAKAQAGKKDK